MVEFPFKSISASRMNLFLSKRSCLFRGVHYLRISIKGVYRRNILTMETLQLYVLEMWKQSDEWKL